MKCRLKINPELRKVANASGCCRVPEAETSNVLCGTEACSTLAKHGTELGMQHQRGMDGHPSADLHLVGICCSQPRLCLLRMRCEDLQQVRCPSAESRDVQVILSVKVFMNVHLDLERQKCKVKQVFDHHKDQALLMDVDWFLLVG